MWTSTILINDGFIVYFDLALPHPFCDLGPRRPSWGSWRQHIASGSSTASWRILDESDSVRSTYHSFGRPTLYSFCSLYVIEISSSCGCVAGEIWIVIYDDGQVSWICPQPGCNWQLRSDPFFDWISFFKPVRNYFIAGKSDSFLSEALFISLNILSRIRDIIEDNRHSAVNLTASWYVHICVVW